MYGHVAEVYAMGVLRQVRAQVVGIRSEDYLDAPSANHFKQASLTPEMKRTIKANSLVRVAGNSFISKSTRDLWSIRNGKVVRLTKTEVDHGESIAGPTGDPQEFLEAALNDLTF